uniref:Uncharacterized protein n=1 Tax=uncultured soil bacterium TaxID=164851 RepID=E2D2Q6_9BACT|nr:hypothetical protein [uncultured soil bacterium]
MKHENRTRTVQLLKWFAAAVIAVEVLLVATGVLDLGKAVAIAVGLEMLCAALALALAVTARLIYRRLRREGVGPWDAFLQAAGTVLPRPLVTLLRHEVGSLLSIGLLIRGRKDVPPDATVIPSGTAHRSFLIVMLVLIPVEIIVVELIVPWPWLRAVLLILAAYSALWLFGFYAGLRTRPHYVDSHQLMVRMGHLAAVSVDVSAVRDIRRQGHDKYKGLVTVTDDYVALPGMSGTGLTVSLQPDTPVRVQGRTTAPAEELRFDADDLDAAIASVRERVEALKR